MTERLPPLLGLTAFEASARRGSFADAGRELHLSASAVSHRVKVLERHLGRRLFQRRASSLVLTDHGQAYLPVVQQALAGLQRGTEGIFGVVPEPRVVTVRAPVSYVSLVLAPRLPSLPPAKAVGARVQLVSSIWGPGGVDVEADLSVELEGEVAVPLGREAEAEAALVGNPGPPPDGRWRRVDVMGFEEMWTGAALQDCAHRIESVSSGRVDTWVAAVETVADTAGWCALVPAVMADAPLATGRVADLGVRIGMRRRFGVHHRPDADRDPGHADAVAAIATWVESAHVAATGRVNRLP